MSILVEFRIGQFLIGSVSFQKVYSLLVIPFKSYLCCAPIPASRFASESTLVILPFFRKFFDALFYSISLGQIRGSYVSLLKGDGHAWYIRMIDKVDRKRVAREKQD